MSNEKEKSCVTALSESATSLTVIFIILKLVKAGTVAHWSWWTVFSPIWVLVALVIVVVIVIGIANKD